MTKWSARGEVAALIGFGLFLVALGVLLWFLAWDSGLEGEGGGALLMLVSAGASALIGQVLAFIGVVAIGVRLGTRD